MALRYLGLTSALGISELTINVEDGQRSHLEGLKLKKYRDIKESCWGEPGELESKRGKSKVEQGKEKWKTKQAMRYEGKKELE